MTGTRGAWLAAAAAATVAIMVMSRLRGLGDTDPYRHLAFAREMWREGLRFHGHAFLPFTLLGRGDVDPWWGFHLLMVPFSLLGVVGGARLAGAVTAATQAGLLALFAQRIGPRSGWLFGLAPVLLGHAYLARDYVARPAHLTVPLLAGVVLAGAGAIPAWSAGVFAFAWGLLHLSSPIAPLFGLAGLVGARLGGSRGSMRSVAFAMLGLAIAYLARPDRSAYLGVALAHNLGALGLGAGGSLVEQPGELAPISAGALAINAGPGALLLIVAVLLSRRRPSAGSLGTRWALALASAIALAMTLKAQRFDDYLVSLLALAAAAWWPRQVPEAPAARGLAIVGVVAVVLLTISGVQRAWRNGDAYIATPESFEAMSDLLRDRVPKGAIVVTDDLIMPGVLWSFAPEYRYVCAYEPTLLYAERPDLYWRWHHVVSEGIACDKASCPATRPNADAIAEMVRAFGSEWLFSFYTRPGFSILPMLFAHPERFELIGSVPGTVGRLSLWHLKPFPAPADAPR